ncbi:MAG: helix-turn-helix domain-containing protein [Pirellulales bacterium]|nr:helix-turn-helix domain-containing protein [Pirellulales bacterium]
MAETTSVTQGALLLKAEEVAQMLAISTRTLWRLVSTAGFPQPLKLGGSTRWRAAEVTAWVEKGCTVDSNDQE